LELDPGRKLGDSVPFVIPTGNFGHALAGYYAKQMGLPIKYLVVATNSNDILHRYVFAGIS
jgi:threonine synthase